MYMMKVFLYCILFWTFISFSLCLYAQNVKYASDYGFSVNATGEENSDALQKAIDGGGRVIVDGKGFYDISKSIFIDSNTELIFGDGVVLNKCKNNSGGLMSHMFINRHAFERTYDENIKIKGLSINMNRLDNGNDIGKILGLGGTLSFFYIKNLIIEDFKSVGGGYADFTIQICTFDSVRVENVYIEGLKDGIHFGRGKNFLVRNCKFKTYDDPIALNAQDYHISNPELGWIENGLIENCYDLEDGYGIGFFCRILAGAWPYWKENMKFQNSDAVISDGKIYRLSSEHGTVEQTSLCKPIHDKGTKTYEDGLTWTLTQKNDIVDHCGVRNVHFKNIYLQKNRYSAFSIHFDNDKFSRSYYPNCTPPIQAGLIFENVYQEANMEDSFIRSMTPIDTLKIINSEIKDARVNMIDIRVDGCDYGKQYLYFLNTSFYSDKPEFKVITNDYNLKGIKAEFVNCKKGNSDMLLSVDDNIEIVRYDITGINKVDNSDCIKISANNGVLFIDSKVETFLNVYDLTGCLVRVLNLDKGLNKFYDLKNGIYILSNTKVHL